jgi:hypothetical protein
LKSAPGQFDPSHASKGSIQVFLRSEKRPLKRVPCEFHQAMHHNDIHNALYESSTFIFERFECSNKNVIFASNAL